MDTFPECIAPQLATLTPAAPEGDEWIHEIKYDGFRLLCRKDGDNVRFFTRNGHDWTEKFPSLVEAVRQVPAETLWLDGELVVLQVDGRACFGSLQEAVHRRDQGCLAYQVFDVMYLNGVDLRELPLIERKEILRSIVPADQWNLKFTDYIRGHGRTFFAHVAGLHMEGIISKKATAPYESGRSRSWLKVKYDGYRVVRTGNWKNWR